MITNSSHLLAIWVPNKMRMTLPWLRKQIDDKEAELKEWRGLLPDYQKAVNQLIAAERELRRLGPGPAPEDPQPGTEDVINMPSSGKPAEEAPIETEGESGGEEPES